METVDYLLKNNNLTVIRFGEGEIRWMNDEIFNSFQEINSEMRIRLYSILISSNPKVLLCIPDVFKGLNKFKHYARIFWALHLKKYSNIWLRFTSENYIYGDSLFSRPYIDLKYNKEIDNMFLKIKKLWEGRDVLIIEGDKTRFGIGNDLLSNTKSIKRIICPSLNAYSNYSKILSTALTINSNNLILVALGPTAKILCYDLSLNNYTCLDVGHLDVEYEWFLRKSTKKITIPGKYVNETTKKWIDQEDPFSKDEEYINSIIKKIT